MDEFHGRPCLPNLRLILFDFPLQSRIQALCFKSRLGLRSTQSGCLRLLSDSIKQLVNIRRFPEILVRTCDHGLLRGKQCTIAR